MKIAILGTGKVAHALGAAGRSPATTSSSAPALRLRHRPRFRGHRPARRPGRRRRHRQCHRRRRGAAGHHRFGHFGDGREDAARRHQRPHRDRDLVYPNSSLGEHLQAALPAVHVVKSLNTAAIEVLADPSLVGPATVFVSGDDEAAKAEVKGLLHDLGWKDEGIIDLGGIQTSRGPEELRRAVLRDRRRSEEPVLQHSRHPLTGLGTGRLRRQGTPPSGQHEVRGIRHGCIDHCRRPRHRHHHRPGPVRLAAGQHAFPAPVPQQTAASAFRRFKQDGWDTPDHFTADDHHPLWHELWDGDYHRMSSVMSEELREVMRALITDYDGSVARLVRTASTREEISSGCNASRASGRRPPDLPPRFSHAVIGTA